jgi:hypothetical protein
MLIYNVYVCTKYHVKFHTNPNIQTQHDHLPRNFWEIGNMGDHAVSLSSPALAQVIIVYILSFNRILIAHKIN